MPIITNNGAEAKALANALAEGATAEEQASALLAFQNGIIESVRKDFEDCQASNDSAILAQRGIRQLTAKEKAFYKGLTEAMKSEKPKQAFADFLATDGAMPETIVNDVFRDLEQNHELLSFINFTYGSYSTKFVRTKGQVAKAVWGKITAAITQEIEDSIDVRDYEQNKLSCYSILPLDIIDMGFEWVDALVRRTMAEALLDALEDGIINGTGINSQPVGMIRDIHHGVSTSSTSGYPSKTAVALADFGEDYLAKVATMAVTESWTEDEVTYGGKPRKVPMVGFIANTKTMLTKVKPALLCVGATGYALAEPVQPTEFIECNAVADDKAIMVVKDGYDFAIAGNRNGNIEYSDEFKFLEDARTFKTMYHAAGEAVDNTACLYVDLTDIKRVNLPVSVQGTVSTKETA